MDKKNSTAKRNGVFSTLGRWLRRMFLGASKDLVDDRFVIEKLESPSKLAVKAFFRRKLAVVALVVLVALFIFVLIGPYFVPINMNYTDSLQADLSPDYTMLSVPKDLAKDVRVINGFSSFTVGVDNQNNFYIWGNTQDVVMKIDVAELPAEIQPGKVLTAAAGSNHVIAITTDGKIVGWGNKSTGQYGYVTEENVPYIQMPEEFITGTVDPNKVDQLICGYQSTVLVLDGRIYAWGNNTATKSLEELSTDELYHSGVKKVALSNYYALVLFEDGTVTGGTQLILNRQSAQSSKDGRITNLKSYLDKNKVVDIAATNNCYAFVLEDGSVVSFGAAEYGETDLSSLPANEKFVSISGGTRHFVAVTESGKTYAWGHNDAGQCDVNGKDAAIAYAGAKQTYLVDENDDVTCKVGLKGYLMGTDKMGRDIFARIIHGGKMTMTIGAVAVVVSSIIAIIIGCLSGYFGGWVDMLLMRITEICSAIPFLPFAMMLSYVIRTKPIDETTRIFIIMIMLGLLSWTGLARMIRGQVLAEREKEFVIAAQSMGVKESRIAFKHILPNVISVILVSMTLDFAGCLLTESSLSYLGFGVQQPQPTWGNMLNGANNSIVIQNYWWQWAFPALFLSIATICINIIGDTLRDVLDPKSSQEK